MMSPLRLLTIGVVIYLIWALLHHQKNKSLTLPILIEYLLTAVLALVLVIGVLI